MKVTSMRLIAKAKNSPQVDPAAASNKVADRHSRIIRHRVAPRARRMVICRSRALARASIKFARLAQAMSKTSPEIPRSNHRDVSESWRNSENPVLAENAPSLYSRYFFTPAASYTGGIVSCKIAGVTAFICELVRVIVHPVSNRHMEARKQ